MERCGKQFRHILRAVLKRVAAERPSGLGREEWVCWSAGTLGEPDAQDGDHAGRERRDPQLPSLSQTADMRANAKMDIGAPKADQFGRPQAHLSGKPKQRLVTPPGPSRPSGGGKQCVEFRFSQEGNEPSVEALWRNGEHTLDHGGMLWMAKRRVAEQRADRGQPSVTGA